MAIKSAGRRRAVASKGRGAESQRGVSPESQGNGIDKRESGYAFQDDFVEKALVTGEHRDLLEAYFGEEAYEDFKTLAAEAQRARVRGGPRVLILPGIMGSKLGRERSLFDDVIWIDPIDIITGQLRLLSLIDGRKDIKPIGVVLLSYLKLKLRLKLAGFDASFHPFDWRKSIPDLGAELAGRIRQETGSGRQDLYLVAHSMGGLVSRSAIKHLGGEDQRVRRVVMLGTPNFGSFSPVQVLSGNHSLVKRVAALDLKNSQKVLVNEVFNTFPGLYQMLPAPQKFSAMDLYHPGSWPSSGMGPRAELLADAAKLQDALAPGNDRFNLIAGINQETVVSVRRDGDKFIFSTSLEGDGTVPLAFARLEGVSTCFVEEEHGSLPNHADVARAVIDLMETGRTGVLPSSWSPDRRGVLREVRAEELTPEPYDGRRGNAIRARELRQMLREFAAPALRIREPLGQPPAVGFSSLTGGPIVVGRKRQRRIDLRLAHCDVTQVDSRAIVLGIFRGVAPSGASRAIDQQLEGVITDFTERRMIAANVGEVFIMPANRYRMGADLVVFAGLGTYDEFNEEVLQIVAENIARALVRTKVDEFATVLLSTGTGMPVGVVLSNLLQGFLRGLAEGDRDGRLRSITLCEIDRERFAQMHADLLRLATTSLFEDIEATVEVLPPPPVPAPAIAARAPIPAEDPVYLIVREMSEPRDKETDLNPDADFVLRASVLTAGSKATVITDTVGIDGARLNAHLGKIENDRFDVGKLGEFGDELARLVLPPLVHQILSEMKDRQIVVIHDARTSMIPWETVRMDNWFPAAGKGLSRKYEAQDLCVAGWLEERRLTERLRILLIVNPTLDLSGAEKEGERIKNLLNRVSAVKIDELWGEAATWTAVRAAFRSGQYDVVHYAGHAFFDPIRRSRSGILCHGRRVLSGRDLIHLEKLPALVFFNACEAGRIRAAEKPNRQPPGESAARRLERNVGLAEAFLRAGVGNFVGTYWPVGDETAERFASVFYRAIMDGDSTGNALQKGRSGVLDLKSVDWADYIHYGSPGFVVKRRGWA